MLFYLLTKQQNDDMVTERTTKCSLVVMRLDWLKEVRKGKEMTGAEVAEAVGVTQQFYNFIENGRRRPSVDVAKRIAAVLGFEWTRFFEE